MSPTNRRSSPDPLALDPLGPIRINQIEDISRTDPLALEPLSPVPAGARRIGTGASTSEPTSVKQ